MSKDTVATLNNLKRDILTLQIPEELHHPSVRFVRDKVLETIDKTIKRKE